MKKYQKPQPRMILNPDRDKPFRSGKPRPRMVMNPRAEINKRPIIFALSNPRYRRK